MDSKKSLDKIFQRMKNVPAKLSLKMNIDGIPLSKSSNVECWPILFEVKELPKLKPFVVGVYCGTSKKLHHKINQNLVYFMKIKIIFEIVQFFRKTRNH